MERAKGSGTSVLMQFRLTARDERDIEELAELAGEGSRAEVVRQAVLRDWSTEELAYGALWGGMGAGARDGGLWPIRFKRSEAQELKRRAREAGMSYVGYLRACVLLAAKAYREGVGT